MSVKIAKSKNIWILALNARKGFQFKRKLKIFYLLKQHQRVLLYRFHYYHENKNDCDHCFRLKLHQQLQPMAVSCHHDIAVAVHMNDLHGYLHDLHGYYLFKKKKKTKQNFELNLQNHEIRNVFMKIILFFCTLLNDNCFCWTA